MIERLTGTLIIKKNTSVVINVNGVGYLVLVSVLTSQILPQINESINILTYQHIREDAMELYGFTEELDREIFLKLITVSGIGPKLALRILSEITPAIMAQHIGNEDIISLTRLKGIGKKTAQMMVASLKPSFEKLEFSNTHIPNTQGNDAIQALISLGIKEAKANEVVEKIFKENPSSQTNEIITEALKIV